MPFYSPYSGTASGTTEYAVTPFLAPRRQRFFLLAPTIVFAARVNQTAFAYPISQVSYDGVTTGAYTDLRVGMTVVFGTAAGLSNLGMQRIRATPTSAILYFGRSSEGFFDGEVLLADNAYITVWDDFRVWARPPYLDDEGVSWKDPGLAVEWRTTTPPPVCNIGPGVAGTIDPGTSLLTVTLPPTANTSFATAAGATITTYLWEVEDGTITVGTSASSQITATFPAGFRWVHLTVTDSEGHSASAHCPIFARDPDADATIPVFEIVSRRRRVSGQDTQVRVRSSISGGTYPPGTLAMLWDAEPTAPTDRSGMMMIGWIAQTETSTEALERATLSDSILELVDVAGRLRELPGFEQFVQDDSLRDTSLYSAITWQHMTALNLDKYIHYLFAWHCSALPLADFLWSGTGSSYIATGLESGAANLWDQIARKASSILPDHVLTCNQLGQIRILPDPMLQETADRSATIQATIDASLWSDIRFFSRRHPRAHWLESNAVQAGNTLPLTLLFCIAPGNAPGQGESHQQHGEALAVSQTALNRAEGHRYARINARQSEFRIRLAQGQDEGIEPADMTWIKLTIPAALAAQRGLYFTEERFLPLEVIHRYEYRQGATLETIELIAERETSGNPAVTVIRPPAPDLPTDDWPGDWHGTPPGAITDPPPVPPLPLYSGQEKVAIIDKYGQIFRTSNFTSGGSDPDWDRKLPSGSGTLPSGSQRIHSFVVDPFSPLYRGTGTTVNGWAASQNYIYKITDIFGTTPTWAIQFTFAQDANDALDRFRSIQASFGRFFAEEADNPWLVCVSYYGNIPTHEGTWATYSVDGGQNWASEGLIQDSYDPDVGTNRDGGIGLYLSPRTPGLAFSARYTPGFEPNSDAEISEDWGATWTEITLPDIDPGDGLAGDIHVPWPDNANERIAYYGIQARGDPMSYALARTNADGSAGASIGPTISPRMYGVGRYSFAVRTFDNDRRYVALAGVGNDVTASEADDYFAAFVSTNYGDDWTTIVSPIAKADPHPEHIAFAADTEQILYLWGTERYIAFSDDFGATIVDKSGNMPTDFPTDIRDLIGLCGGDAPP